MRVVQFLSVSIFLFCNNVIAPATTTISHLNTGVLSSVKNKEAFSLITKTPVFFRSLKGSNHNHSQSITYENAGHMMTAKINSTKNLSDRTDNLRNLGEELVNEQDDLLHADEKTQQIYSGTLGIFILQWQTWLENNEDLSKISSYLGLSPMIIDVINASVTELLYQHSLGIINVDHLISSFFYSCDIKNMINDNSYDVDNVKKKFEHFLKIYEVKKTDVPEISTDYKIYVCVKSLIRNLILMDPPVNPSYTVSIALMKNEILIDTSENKNLNKLKDRYLKDYHNINELAKSYVKEINTNKVLQNHVDILGRIIPDVFGFAYNHFELLTALSEYEFNIMDKNYIETFSKFLNGFLNTFVHRAFVFKGESNLEFDDSISPLVYFLDPESSTESHTETSILNYYNESERNPELIEFMWKLMNTALVQLLHVFGDENVDEWKNHRSFKIDYPEGDRNKEYYLNLIKSNTNDAIDTIGIFSRNYIYGTEDIVQKWVDSEYSSKDIQDILIKHTIKS